MKMSFYLSRGVYSEHTPPDYSLFTPLELEDTCRTETMMILGMICYNDRQREMVQVESFILIICQLGNVAVHPYMGMQGVMPKIGVINQYIYSILYDPNHQTKDTGNRKTNNNEHTMIILYPSSPITVIRLYFQVKYHNHSFLFKSI